MGTRTPTLAELVGDEDEFFATYHTRRTLLRRGAVAGDPREILSVADMDDIVHQRECARRCSACSDRAPESRARR